MRCLARTCNWMLSTTTGCLLAATILGPPLTSLAASPIEDARLVQTDALLDLPDLPMSGTSDGQAPNVKESTLFEDIPSVYGAAKYEQKVNEAPAAVIIITADQIKKYGYRNFAQILDSVPGLFTSNDRNYGYLGIRGFDRPGDYTSRVLLLIDNHRLNDAVYDAGGTGTDVPIDVDLIDRVEIIKGPGSSLYGTNAFFGVVNVITKRGRDLRARRSPAKPPVSIPTAAASVTAISFQTASRCSSRAPSPIAKGIATYPTLHFPRLITASRRMRIGTTCTITRANSPTGTSPSWAATNGVKRTFRPQPLEPSSTITASTRSMNGHTQTSAINTNSRISST